jgi:hypothetical protein
MERSRSLGLVVQSASAESAVSRCESRSLEATAKETRSLIVSVLR